MEQYMTEIIIAVLSLIGAALGSYSGFKLTAYRVEQLEKKVEMHNSFAARIPLLERDINEVNEKTNELERKIGRS